jgi:hypothetical protein
MSRHRVIVPLELSVECNATTVRKIRWKLENLVHKPRNLSKDRAQRYTRLHKLDSSDVVMGISVSGTEHPETLGRDELLHNVTCVVDKGSHIVIIQDKIILMRCEKNKLLSITEF